MQGKDDDDDDDDDAETYRFSGQYRTRVGQKATFLYLATLIAGSSRPEVWWRRWRMESF